MAGCQTSGSLIKACCQLTNLLQIDTGFQKLSMDDVASFTETSAFPECATPTTCMYLTYGQLQGIIQASTKLDIDEGQLAFKVSRNELAAIVVFQLTVQREQESWCLLLALRVDEPMRKHKLGTSLYLAMHRFCFVVCQGSYPPEKPLYEEECTHSNTRYALRSTLCLSLGPGECRRKQVFLSFLCSLGWTGID